MIDPYPPTGHKKAISSNRKIMLCALAALGASADRWQARGNVPATTPQPNAVLI